MERRSCATRLVPHSKPAEMYKMDVLAIDTLSCVIFRVRNLRRQRSDSPLMAQIKNMLRVEPSDR